MDNNLSYFSPLQFSVFRFVFGLYIFVHFVCLLPFASDIWSNQGMMADPALNFTYGKFPNILNYIDSPTGITVFVGLLAACALGIISGYYRRTCALILWYG